MTAPSPVEKTVSREPQASAPPPPRAKPPPAPRRPRSPPPPPRNKQPPPAAPRAPPRLRLAANRRPAPRSFVVVLVLVLVRLRLQDPRRRDRRLGVVLEQAADGRRRQALAQF